MWSGRRDAGRETRSPTPGLAHSNNKARANHIILCYSCPIWTMGTCGPVMSFPHLPVLSRWGHVPGGIFESPCVLCTSEALAFRPTDAAGWSSAPFLVIIQQLFT